MNDTNPPTPVPDNSLESLLGTVSSDQRPSDGTEGMSPTPVSAVPPIAPIPPKKKAPMRPADFLKIVGALFAVALIFFGSFLAYVVFNPGQAQFFIQFGINPGDIATLLERLVNGIFGGITFFVSIVSIVYLFRAIVTKKEYKRKKTVSTILAIFFMALLFSNISFWAYLIKTIGAEDFVNPNGGVVVYDNDRFLSERFKNSSEVRDFNNLIGPVVLRFDLDSDARYASKLLDIDSYQVDFDGDGTADKEGNDPQGAKDLVFTYSKKGKYVPKGAYVGKDKITHEAKTMQIVLPVVNVTAVVSVTATKKGTVYDAKDTSSIGNPKWYDGSNLNTPVSTDSVYTVRPSKEERFLCLVLVNNKSKGDECDKVFVVKSQGDEPIQAKITVIRPKSEDPLTYHFSLEDVKVTSGGDVTDYQWTLDGGSIFCKEEECDWTFNEYGKKKVSVRLTDAAKNSVNIDYELNISRPLLLSKTSDGNALVKVTDETGKNLLEGTYDQSADVYRVENLNVPSNIRFDARDVTVKNAGYSLDSVDWSFDGKEHKTGDEIEYEIAKEGRLEVIAKYSFIHSGTDERAETEERFVFTAKKKDLAAEMKIFQDSEYAPSTIRFDGSASRTKNGTITKFVYDFGAGKPPAEGDAVQTYRYDAPGEYLVTFTVVKDDGTKDSTIRKIVLKDLPKSLTINTSVSSGIVGRGIDFDVFGSVGQIEAYSWDFGDSSILSTDPTPSHAYEASGTYAVKLQVRYADGTLRNAEKEITVR